MSSFPVPLSPSINTVAELGAAWLTISRTWRMPLLWPMISLRTWYFSSSPRRRRFSRNSDRFSNTFSKMRRSVARLNGLGMKSVCPFFHRLDRGFNRSVSGHQNHINIATNRAGCFEEFDSVHRGHFEVGEDDVDRFFFSERIKSFVASFGLNDAVVFLFEDFRHRRPIGGVIFDEKDRAFQRAGSHRSTLARSRREGKRRGRDRWIDSGPQAP